MPASGTSGADLFCRDANHSGTYRFVGAVQKLPSAAGETVAVPLGYEMPPGEKHCLVNLPLRNTLHAGAIGVNPGASLLPDPLFAADGVTLNGKKPVVWYGTSIDQGGVASRPGSTYTNIMTRNLGRMVLNFGFAVWPHRWDACTTLPKDHLAAWLRPYYSSLSPRVTRALANNHPPST